jgi:hypothetical protein
MPMFTSHEHDIDQRLTHPKYIIGLNLTLTPTPHVYNNKLLTLPPFPF